MTTTVTPWAIGNRITGARLNNQGIAVTEQQTAIAALGTRVTALEAATAMLYNSTRTVTEAAYGWTDYGAWGSASGFTGSGTGVLAPTDGIYLVNLAVVASSGSWNGRTYHDIDVGGFACGRSSTAPNLGEDTASVSCVSWHIPAGTLIRPTYLNNGSSARSCSVTLTICRLSL